MSSRAVCLVDRLEFDFSGNMYQNALTIGDIDNDGNNEFVIGNENGNVAVFKGTERWQTITEAGMITCVAVGDLFNQNRNVLVIISSEGWCYIYSSPSHENSSKADVPKSTEEVDGQLFSSQSQIHTESVDSSLLKRVHVQRVPANCKVVLLEDIDGDGCIEMVVGLTDRVVRSYRWMNNPEVISTATGARSKRLGKLVGLNKWESANQIGSVTLHYTPNGHPCILVAQPGGTFMRIRCQSDEGSNPTSESLDQSENASTKSELAASNVDYQFLGSSRMRNQNISTEILGNLKKKGESESKSNQRSYCIATLDGTIMLLQDDIILWALQTDRHIFTLSKMDVTKDGSDEIIACAWDGQTYILDQDKNSVGFALGEPVKAFCSGYYTAELGQEPVPSLVYITFKNKIYIYHDIDITRIVARRFEPDLSPLLELNLREDHPLRELLNDLNPTNKKRIVRYLLYEVKR